MKQKLLFTSLLAFMLLISVRGWGQYAGTGTFTKITSVEELTDGYYVILNEADEFLMTNGRSGSAATGYFISAAISPSSGTITDPSINNVWKIEENGAGKTIYNESIGKYVGWSSGNSASIEDVPANTNRWTFTYEDNKFTVNNVATTERQLSYNSGAPRFAAYKNNGQQELQLYKIGALPSTPTISLSPTSLSGFTYAQGNGPSAEQTFTVSGSNLMADINIAATTNYEISKTSGSGYATPLTFAQTDGTVAETTVYVRLKAGLAVRDYNGEEITATSSGAENKIVTCSGSVTAPPPPTIILSESALAGFTYIEDAGPSTEQTFTVEGSNLDANISITASTNYEISTGTGGSFTPINPIVLSQTDGTVAETTVYVRLKAGLAIGTYDEDITATSTGADEKTVSCSGSVTAIPAPGYLVDFEGDGETKGSYASGTVTLSGMDWNMTEALIGSDAADWKNGIRSARMRGYGASAMTMIEDKSNGIGTVSFNYRRYGTDSQADWKVEYSTNAGTNWTQIGSSFTAPSDDVVQLFSEVVDLSGNIRIRIKRATETGTSNARLNIDDIMLSDFGSGTAPIISNIVQTPDANILSTTTVSVSADVTDSDGTIEGVALHWGTTSGSLTNNIDMSLGSGSTYTTVTDIPAQLNGVTVYYEIYALDNDAAEATSPEQSYTVTDPVTEPTNHPTGFTAEANSSSAIIVAWDDAIPAAAGYLIKGSATSYEAIVSPADGTPENDALLVQNIVAGNEIHEFTGLTASTQYFFKIYPFNGSGTEINYKTDGNVPEATATTEALPSYDFIETFDNFSETGSSYADGTFTGQDGSTWSYFQSRGDVAITGKALMIGRDRDPQSMVYSGTISGGIQVLNFDYMQAFGTNVNLNVLVNDVVVGNVTSSSEQDVVKNSGNISVNVSGDFVLKFINANNSDGQVVIDNISWISVTAFTTYMGSGNWNVVGNWSKGIPDEFTDAIIKGSVTVNDVAECKNLTISPHGTVTVAAGKSLIINNNLLIESNPNGTGSFIGAGDDYLVGETSTIQRYVTGGQTAGSTYKYHLLSIPLADDIFAGDVFTGTYLWNFIPNVADAASWVGITEEDDILDYQKGFLSYVESPDYTFSFTGDLNTGSFNSAAETLAAGKFKLIPNPYPSAIDWEKVTKTDIENAVYFYNSETGNYVSYLDNDLPGGQQYIPVGQAVFVKAKNANPTITFDNSVRVHNGQPFYKNATQTYKDVLKIAVSANNSADAAFIRFRELADNNYNGFDDASKLRGFAGAPQLYTQSEDDKALSINTLATSQETVIVPLAYELEVAGDALLSFEYLETFDAAVNVFLEDLLLDKMINLREQTTYSFEHAAENDPLRFNIHFMGVTNVNEMTSTPDNFTIWASEKQLYIMANNAVDGKLQIDLFDLSGRLLNSVSQSMQAPNSISLPDYEGIIMVRVRNNSAIQTQKVFIR
ncbi:MAG: fibronectin type III domain-containing protein [Bacteroidales bacterium]|nr:fibronectin type III domain-containing protein [Bacteroidales bacterium]